MIRYHVYAGDTAGGPIDYSAPVATVDGTTWTGPAVAPGSARRFGVRAFDAATGLEERNLDAAVTVARDATGVDTGRLPPAPGVLMATPVAGGKVRLDWAWIAPMGTLADRFDLVADGSATPFATIYGGMSGRYSATAIMPPGTAFIGVVAVVNGVASRPANVAAPAIAAPPSPPENLVATVASTPAL